MNGGTEGRPGARHIIFGILVVCAALLLPRGAHAATLFVAPSTGQFGIGKTFSVVIRVNSQGQAINAVEGTLSFNPALLQVVSVTSPGSIFNLNVQDPEYSNTAGTVRWTGVILNPGYNGSSGNLLTVTFKGAGQGTAQVNYASAAVLANDGHGTNVLTGTSGGTYTIGPGAPAQPTPTSTPAAPSGGGPVITSPTHPDSTKWYSNNDPQFKWDLPAGVDAVSFLVNPKADANPGNASDGLVSATQFTDVPEGPNFFHLKFRLGGVWGPIAHFAFNTDTGVPESFAVSRVDETDATEPRPLLAFTTTDTVSGVSRYLMKINEGEWVQVEPGTREEPSAMSLLAPGTYVVVVEAVDAAGNATRATTTITVQSIPRPVITEHPDKADKETAFTVKGTAPADSLVRLRALRVSGRFGRVLFSDDPAAVVEARVDSAGRWSLQVPGLADGVYRLEANAIDSRGAVSDPSDSVMVRVGYSLLWRFWDFIRSLFDGLYWLTVLAWFLILLALLAFLRWLWFWFGKRRLPILVGKRSSDDVADKLRHLIADIEDELALLARVAKHRPLYPEEKYLRSKLMQYRRTLKFLALNPRRVAKE